MNHTLSFNDIRVPEMVLEFIYDKNKVNKFEQNFLEKVFDLASKEFEKTSGIIKVTQYFPHEFIELENGWDNAIYPGKTETVPETKKNIASEVIFDALKKAKTL